MYQSREYLSKDSYAKLKKDLSDYLMLHVYVACKALRHRKIFFSKLPEAITRRKGAKNRLQCFWVALDILRRSSDIKERIDKGKREYEITGFSAEGKQVFIHLREEKIKKDRKLFLVSTYFKL